MSDSLEVVSVEQDGRVLSGIGADADALRETMDRHSAPEAEEAPTPAAVTAPVETTEPKPSRGQKRFADLTREREDANRRAEAAEARIKEYEAKLAAAPTARVEPKAPPAPVPAPQPVATRSKPSEDEVGAKYQTYADFVEDLADWKAEQRLAALDFDARIRTSIEADRASRSHLDVIQQTFERGRVAFPDFDAVLKSAPHANAEDWPLEKLKDIFALPEAEHIVYALAKDATLNSKLRDASPVQFGMELAKLIHAVPVAPLASTGHASSVPPAPYQPVGSGSKTAVTPSADLAKKGFDFDKSGYREKRAAERGVNRKK